MLLQSHRTHRHHLQRNSAVLGGLVKEGDLTYKLEAAAGMASAEALTTLGNHIRCCKRPAAVDV